MHSDHENLEKLRNKKYFFRWKNDVTSPYYLSVSPAVTRLTVYRRLQVRIGSPSSRIHYRPFDKMGAVFSFFFEKAAYSNPFSDFSGLDLMLVQAHARGFAPLWALARGNRDWKIGRRTSKNDVKIENFWKSRKWSRMVLGWLYDHILMFECFFDVCGSKNWCKIWWKILMKIFKKMMI